MLILLSIFAISLILVILVPLLQIKKIRQSEIIVTEEIQNISPYRHLPKANIKKIGLIISNSFKKYGHLLVIAILKGWVIVTYLIRKYFSVLLQKIKRLLKIEKVTTENKAVSGFLKKVSEYKKRLKKMREKIKENEVKKEENKS